MKRLFYIIALVCLGVLLFPLQVNADTNQFEVAEVNNNIPLGATFQRNSFDGAGRIWAFYYTNSQIYYRSSLNGEDWSSATLFPAEYATNGGHTFSIWWDDPYVHIVYGKCICDRPDSIVRYRRGTPYFNGSIVWGNSSIAYDTPEDWVPFAPVVITDTSGYPYLGLGIRNEIDFLYSFNVTKSSTNNGTWTTEWDIPLSVSATTGDMFGTIVPLSNGSIYALCYGKTSKTVNGSLYDSGWKSNVSIDDSSGTDYYAISAVAVNNDVHLVYKTTTTLNHTVWTGTWSTPEVIETSFAAFSWATLARKGTLIYAYYPDSPANETMFYRRYVSSWDDRVAWFEDTDFDTLPQLNAPYDLTKDGAEGLTYKAVNSYHVQYAVDEDISFTILRYLPFILPLIAFVTIFLAMVKFKNPLIAIGVGIVVTLLALGALMIIQAFQQGGLLW